MVTEEMDGVGNIRESLIAIAFLISHLHDRGSCQSQSPERERLIWVPNHVQSHVLLSLKKKSCGKKIESVC